MSFPLRLFSRAWIFVVIGACGFSVWTNAIRMHRVDYVSQLAADSMVTDPKSPTGYAGGLRRLIVPEHNNESYEWIAQTQQMFTTGQWRVRHVVYDNAPAGREIYSASIYRWWLGLLSWIDHAISGRPIGASVERAALYADPMLQLGLIVSIAIFVRRYFGGFAAGLLSVGIAALFPLAGAFLPGQPDDHTLSIICGLWSVLPLVVGIRYLHTRGEIGARAAGEAPLQAGDGQARRCFFVGGAIGGVGLWIGVANELPLLIGLGLGGILAAVVARRMTKASAVPGGVDAPWREWALGGAIATLVTSLVDYFPSHLGGLQLRSVHPLHGLAWLGGGELLLIVSACAQGRRPGWNRRTITRVTLATVALVPVAGRIAWLAKGELFAADALATRLSSVPYTAMASNLWSLIYRDGFTLTLVATCLPLLLVGLAVWQLMRAESAADLRVAIVVGLGPVAVALAFACFQLRWWSIFDVLLLATVAVGVARPRGMVGTQPLRWLWSGCVGLALIPGLIISVQSTIAGMSTTVSATEVESLIERDLAHWLANRVGGGRAIVLAPPNLTTSFYFHGGLRGLGTADIENKDGFNAAVRIASATSPDEAQALVRRREVTHVVMPSWDSMLDEYAHLGANQTENSLIGLLHQWQPPRWLRAIPYQLPNIPGFEGRSVAIFEVVDVQENAVALSHLAEYFIETGEIAQAASVSQALERLFPEDFGAMVARAQVDAARRDTGTFAKAVDELSAYLVRGDDPGLPWERRVSLAIVLAEGKRFELAKQQVRRCLAEIDEPQLRSLTTVSLYRFLLLTKVLGEEIKDAGLRELARGLLPVEMRERL